MADVRKILIEIDAKTGNVVGGIGQVNKQLDALGAKARVSTNEVSKAAKAMQKDLAGSAGIAGAAATELGRTISDLPFGLTAVTNNISQLGNMFALLVTNTKSVGGALRALWSTLMGPVGILIAFQAVVAGVEMFAQSQRKAKKDTDDLTQSLNLEAKAIEGLLASFNIDKLIEDLDYLTGDDGTGGNLKDLKKQLNDVVTFLINRSSDFKEAFESLTPDEQMSIDALQRLVKEYGSIIKIKNDIKDLNESLKKEGLTEDERVNIEGQILKTEIALMNRLQAFRTRMSQEIDTDINTFYDFGADAAEALNKGFVEGMEKAFVEQGGAFFDPKLADLDPDSIPYIDILEEEGERALLQEIENNERLRRERERAAQEKLDIEIATINALADIKMMEADIVESVFKTIADVTKQSRFLQALALIGESAAGIAKIIIDTKAANAAITLRQSAPFIDPITFGRLQLQKRLNNTAAAAGIAANVGATSTALTKLRAPVGAPSAQSVSGSEAGSFGGGAPSFNVIGATGQNQLAAAIAGTQQEPMRAYVVAGDVTTAQSLERNIVTEASI